MARRRSPHTPMSTNLSSSSSSSPSSDGFEDNIPRMAVSSHTNRNHDEPALASSSSFITSIKRSWLRVNNQKWKKMALLVCFLVMMANLLLAIIKPGSRLLTRGSTGNNLRAHHDVPTSKKNGELLNAESSSASIQQNQELLQALYEIPIPTTHAELNSLNEEFNDLHPQFIVQWAHHHLHSTSSESPPPPSSSSSSSSSYQHNPSQSKLVQVTSFGPTGLVVLDLLYQSKLLGDVPVITMDTLHLFPESYDFYNTVRSHYKNLLEEKDDSSTNGIIINGNSSGKEKKEKKKKNAMNLIITKPLHITYPPSMMGEGVISGALNNRAQFETQYGTTALWKTNREKFTKLTKIDPLRKALSELGVEMWMTGRRRSSGGERASMDVLEFEEFEVMDRSGGGGGGGGGSEDGDFDLRRGRWKLNPLAYWTYDQVWDYIRKHKLPYNVLYDKGYTSLGDTMTTGLPKSKPGIAADNNGLAAGNNGDAVVAVDAFERSGRFIGMGTNNECGLHSHIQKVKEQKQHALDAGEEFTAPTLPCDHCVELNLDNFEHHIANQGGVGGEVLVEFYSPYCGACQDFAPTLNRVANHLAEVDPLVQVARFDITEHEIPNVNGEALFKVDSTPTLYRVRYTPKFHVDLYEGQHDFKSIMRWLT